MQAGGHEDAFVFEGGRVTKEVKEPEAQFYTNLYAEGADETLVSLRPMVPRFYGSEQRGDKTYVVMENLCEGLAAPCIMDCKLGRVAWAPGYSAEKIAHQVYKGDKTTSNLLGFRISGQVIRDPQGTVVKSWMKGEGFFGISGANISQVFTDFVTINGRVRYDVVQEFRDKTLAYTNWFIGQHELHFVATSVLYVYDQAAEGANVSVRLIDFAHVLPGNGPDHSEF